VREAERVEPQSAQRTESSLGAITSGAAHLVCVTITLQAAPTTNASAHRQANDRITRSSNMTWELLQSWCQHNHISGRTS